MSLYISQTHCHWTGLTKVERQTIGHWKRTVIAYSNKYYRETLSEGFKEVMGIGHEGLLLESLQTKFNEKGLDLPYGVRCDIHNSLISYFDNLNTKLMFAMNT